MEIEIGVGMSPSVDSSMMADESVEFRTLPEVETAASLIYEGPYADLGPAIFEMLRWIGVHKHVPIGSLRELHLSGPAHPDVKPEELPIVELQVPIESVTKNQSIKRS